MPLVSYDAFDRLDWTQENIRRIIIKLCELISVKLLVQMTL